MSNKLTEMARDILSTEADLPFRFDYSEKPYPTLDDFELYTFTCTRCGCKFSYDLDELGSINYVLCPDCGEKCYHQRQDTHSSIVDYALLNSFNQSKEE